MLVRLMRLNSKVRCDIGPHAATNLSTSGAIFSRISSIIRPITADRPTLFFRFVPDANPRCWILWGCRGACLRPTYARWLRSCETGLLVRSMGHLARLHGAGIWQDKYLHGGTHVAARR